ncbi:hypothetical protein M0R45_036296 [Rubus argutus]|uniref:MHC class I antigen n=1 Tax=Rubus argutus TaxID=59490 RepID=A0AAW1VZ80_RUBAR
MPRVETPAQRRFGGCAALVAWKRLPSGWLGSEMGTADWAPDGLHGEDRGTVEVVRRRRRYLGSWSCDCSSDKEIWAKQHRVAWNGQRRPVRRRGFAKAQ